MSTKLILIRHGQSCANLAHIFGGQDDLNRGVLRCVGDPEKRFSEDALRILRALRFAAVLEFEIEPATAAALRRNFAAHGGCLQTGFLGTSILMDTLTENGLADLAYTLLLQHKNPSWLYSVDQGATTIWERWNSYTKDKGFGPVGMNSFNHYAYGAVLAWIYKTAAGIAADPSAPGFRNIVMAPVPDRRLGWVKAKFRTPSGEIIRSESRPLPPLKAPRRVQVVSAPKGRLILTQQQVIRECLDKGVVVTVCGPEDVRRETEDSCLASPVSRPLPGDAFIILYTSGSTGNPKGILLTFDVLDNNYPHLYGHAAPGPDMVLGSSAPFFPPAGISNV